MKLKFFLLIAAFAACSFVEAQGQMETIPKEESSRPASKGEKTLPSYMNILPKSRALDYKQAFDVLRREKTAAKVFFQLTSGATVSNIIDMSLMEGGTLVLFRYTTAQGVKLMVVPVEEIAGVSY